MNLNNVYTQKLEKAKIFLKKFKDEVNHFEVRSKSLFIEGQKWDYKFDYGMDSISVIEKKEYDPRILVVERAGI